jgi:glycine oxidase
VKTYDVVIVGGGVIGCSIALALSRRKMRVGVLDRQEMLREASWAAAGMLSPAPDCSAALPLVPLARASMALYPQYVVGLEETSHLSAGYREDGTLEALFHGDSQRDLGALVALHRGLGLACRPVEIAEALEMEPALGSAICAAALLPDEASVNVRALCKALLTAVEISGVDLFPGKEVTSLIQDGNSCHGVNTAAGETFFAAEIVMAAGCWTNQIADIEKYAPTSPVRGQMVSLIHKGRPIHRVLRSERAYIVPRGPASPQNLVVGSTLEDAGYEKCVTSVGLEKILSAVNEFVPELAKAEILETWSGLRPGTPDQLPILGPTRLQGLAVATGHYRNGILLAPVTASLMEEWIVDRKISPAWKIFSPLRFSETDERSGARARSKNSYS